ncbi:hypothetical protein CN918_25645 [Priestia megaterium]|nr:hypothetical protein CN918_25645 [Priestia megaterium]
MKKWGIIMGSSLVATAAINLFSSFPTIAPILLFISIMGGAAWATFEEIKEDVKQLKKEPPTIFSLYQMEKEFHSIEEQVKAWDIDSITYKVQDISMQVSKLSTSYNMLTHREKTYIQQTLIEDVKTLLRAFEAFHPDERLNQSQSLIEVLEKVSQQMKEIYNKKQREAEDAFQETKRVIQEKLTRY